MKKVFIVIGLAAAVIGCGKSGGDSEDARARSRPGAIQSEPAGAGPTEKDKPGVEFPGLVPAGPHTQSSNVDSGKYPKPSPFGTGRANSGSYERTNNQER